MRVQSNRKVNTFKKMTKWFVLLLTLSLITGMSMPILAEERLGPRDQVVKSGVGETNYYGIDGSIGTVSNYDISVNKTVSQLIDASSNAVENQFTVKLIVESTTNYQMISNTDVVTDVLPVRFTFNENSFSGQGDFAEENGTIKWSLSGIIPDSSKVVNGKTIYNYKMTYQVTVNNLDPNANNLQVQHALNNVPTTFSYTNNGEKSVAFNIPVIETTGFMLALQKAYMPDLITQVNLTGAIFDLYVDVGPEGITEATVPYKKNISDAIFGDGFFMLGLHSGHTYLLKETVAPKGYKLAEEPWQFSVQWGSVMSNSRDASPIVSINLHNDKLPEKKDIKVVSQWIDSESPLQHRPSVTYALYYGSALEAEKQWSSSMSLPANSANGDFVLFKDVPTLDADKNPYTYRVEQMIENSDGTYSWISTTPIEEGFEVTNKYNPLPQYGLRINRVYEYSVDGDVKSVETITGNEIDNTYFVKNTAFNEDVDTNNYISFDGKEYTFDYGSTTINELTLQSNSIVSGVNSITVDQENSEQVITLHYKLNEITEDSETPTPPTDTNKPDSTVPPNQDISLPQSPIDKIEANTTSNTTVNPKTGDVSTINLFLMLTLLTSVSIIFISQKKRIKD